MYVTIECRNVRIPDQTSRPVANLSPSDRHYPIGRQMMAMRENETCFTYSLAFLQIILMIQWFFNSRLIQRLLPVYNSLMSIPKRLYKLNRSPRIPGYSSQTHVCSPLIFFLLLINIMENIEFMIIGRSASIQNVEKADFCSLDYLFAHCTVSISRVWGAAVAVVSLRIFRLIIIVKCDGWIPSNALMAHE